MRAASVDGRPSGWAERLAGLAGVSAAVCWIVLDVLLLGLRTRRLATGERLGALIVPLSLAGAWHVYRGLRAASAGGKPFFLSPSYFLLSCAFVLAPLVHGFWVRLGQILETVGGVDRPSGDLVLTLSAPSISDRLDVYYPVLAIAALVGLVWFTVIVALGRTRYPPWAAILSPLLLIIAGSLVNDLLPGPMAQAGAGFNLGLLLFFILSSALLWRERLD